MQDARRSVRRRTSELIHAHMETENWMDCTILAKRMCVSKLYLDSLLSESDWGGFVVRFGLNYLTQKRFGPDKQTTEDSGQTSD